MQRNPSQGRTFRSAITLTGTDGLLPEKNPAIFDSWTGPPTKFERDQVQITFGSIFVAFRNPNCTEAHRINDLSGHGLCTSHAAVAVSRLNGSR